MELKIIKRVTLSILDCECKGDGYVFLSNGVDMRCPAHFECALNEEYRIQMLRIEYQNFRGFVLQTSMLNNLSIDLTQPTTAKEVDEYLMRHYEIESPSDWIRAIQSHIRETLDY